MIEQLKKDLVFGDVLLEFFPNLIEDEKRLVLEWRNSKTVRSGMYNNEEISWEEHTAFFKGLETADDKLYYLAFIGGQPVGVVYFTRIDSKHKRGVYGIYLRPDTNFPPNTGELLKDVILELAFEQMGFNTVNSEVLSDNKLAYIYNMKGGFKKEGTLRSYISRGNKQLDVVLFGMLKDEYLELKGKSSLRA